MDLLPKPDQVVAAVGNVAHKTFYGGLADMRPMPRTLIEDGELREVYHYRPQASSKEQGDPVLLVTPLAASSIWNLTNWFPMRCVSMRTSSPW